MPTLKVYTFDDAKQPRYHSDQAVAFDIAASHTRIIAPKGVAMIPTGLVIKPEAGYWVMIAGRSSLTKRGLMLANNVGIIDPDYCGEQDEIKLQIYNFGEEMVEINVGDRLAQGIVLPRCQATIEPFVPDDESRGGFGSTGQ